MSSKTTIAMAEEIRKSISTGTSTRVSAVDKSNFRIKKYQSPKNPFGVAAMCADGGTTFTAMESKD